MPAHMINVLLKRVDALVICDVRGIHKGVVFIERIPHLRLSIDSGIPVQPEGLVSESVE